MRFRTTLLLILVLAGLGAYVYFVEYPKAEEEAKKKTLFELKADDVTQVTLDYGDHKIVLKKSGADWRMTEPLDVPADATTAKNLASAIADCEVKHELKDASADLSQYGLDKPFVTVTVKAGDKELPAFMVGKNTPVGFSTYVQRADDKKIQLTGSAFRSGVDKKVKDLRDKTIIDFVDGDVQRLELSGDGKELVLVQKDDKWTIEQPASYAADGSTVRSFLSTLRSMRATDFPDDQPADLATYGLDKPQLKIALHLGKDNAEKSILIGKENDKKEIFVQRAGQPTVYTVSDWVLRDLNKNPADFRDKTVLAFDRDKVTAVELKRKDGSHTKLVHGANNQWQVEGAEGKPAETVITQYLTDLHDLKGYEIAADQPADLAQFGLDQPSLAVSVFGENNKPVGTALLGARDKDGKKEYTALLEGGPTVFLVRDYLFTRLDKQPKDFIEKPPAPTVAPGSAPAPAAVNDDEHEDEGDGGDEQVPIPGGDEQD
jgi:ribosomal protein L14E/L6E/L27E